MNPPSPTFERRFSSSSPWRLACALSGGVALISGAACDPVYPHDDSFARYSSGRYAEYPVAPRYRAVYAQPMQYAPPIQYARPMQPAQYAPYPAAQAYPGSESNSAHPVSFAPQYQVATIASGAGPAPIAMPAGVGPVTYFPAAAVGVGSAYAAGAGYDDGDEDRWARRRGRRRRWNDGAAYASAGGYGTAPIVGYWVYQQAYGSWVQVPASAQATWVHVAPVTGYWAYVPAF